MGATVQGRLINRSSLAGDVPVEHPSKAVCFIPKERYCYHNNEASKAIEDTLETVKFGNQAICSESTLFAKPHDGGSEFLLLRCRASSKYHP